MATRTKVQFLEDEQMFTGAYSKSVLETLYYAYRPYLGRILFCVFVGFFGRIALLSNANFIGYWADSLCTAPAICKPPPDFLLGFTDHNYLILLLTVTLCGFGFGMFYRVGFSRLSAMAVSHLYDEVTLRASRYPMSFFDATPAGRIITRFSSDYGNVFRLFGGPLAEFFNIIFDLICMVFLISIASPYYLPIVLVVGVFNYIVYRANRQKLRIERRETSRLRSPSIAHFAESSQGASSIRTYQKQRSFARRFDKLQTVYLGQRLNAMKAILGFSFQMSLLTAVLLLTTGIASYYLAQTGRVSIGSIGVAFGFIAFSGNTIQNFFDWMAQFEEAMVGVERLDEYLRKDLEPGLFLPNSSRFPTPHPRYSARREAFNREHLTSPHNVAAGAAIRFENVWLRYRENLPWVLSEIDFEVKAGERIGIVGRTGSGKSSLIQALFQLYPLSQGHIKIDGMKAQTNLSVAEPNKLSVDEMDLTVFRRKIALISQEPTLLRGTLRENLALDIVYSDEALLNVLTQVGLDEWLYDQAAGLDLYIEERGKNLSAGEKQLICMARCLLQQSPIVVMDEATSSVDPQSEEIMVRATAEIFAGRTQLIIAHRLSTLLNCDRILWLKDGKVHMLDQPSKVLPAFESTRHQESHV